MTCSDANPLLNAYFDGELDLTGSLEVERHLSECETCSLLYRKFERLRDEIADAGLNFGDDVNVGRLRALIRRRVHRPLLWFGAWRTPWIPALAAAALLVLAVIVPGGLFRRGDQIDREIVDSHVRSLMSDHLLDVPSSDHHTVKPWFQGKLNFSPPVPDLTARGFVLTGGRLDIIAGRPAAAIVYRRRQHVINLWIAPAVNAGSKPDEKQLDGFHLLRWQSGTFSYWAVSDVNLAELRVFAELVRAAR